VGATGVLAEILYTDLVGIELCEPRGLVPFIGLRLQKPQVFDKRMSGLLLAGERRWRRFGFDWAIPMAMSAEPYQLL
jgi:hypothetical protein